MLDVLDAGADRLADDGAVEKQPDADIDQGGDGDDHQTIDRDIRAHDGDLGQDRLGTGRGTSPQKYLMTPTPPIRTPNDVIMVNGKSRS